MAGVVPFDDWVFSLASRGEHLLAGVSSRLHVLDVTTLKPLKRIWHQVIQVHAPCSFVDVKTSSCVKSGTEQ